MGKMVGIAEFKAHCTRLIGEMERDGEPISITRRGKVVAVMRPVETPQPKSRFGFLKGSVVRYDDPFEPAVDPREWDVNR